MSSKKWCENCAEAVKMFDVFECPRCGGLIFSHVEVEGHHKYPIKATGEMLEPRPEKKLPISGNITQTILAKQLVSNKIQASPNFELSELSRLIELQEKTIAASNRTTHAIRAFVLFLFYQLTAATLAVFVYRLAFEFPDENSLPNSFLTITSGIIWLVGIVLSSNKGWTEIRKSDL